MVEAGALLLLAALAAPYALPLERVSPAAAGAVWLAVLALRALIVLGLALSALLLLPATHLFHRVTDWSGYEIVGSLQQQCEDMKGLGRKVEAHACLAQLTRVEIQLEHAEPDHAKSRR